MHWQKHNQLQLWMSRRKNPDNMLIRCHQTKIRRGKVQSMADDIRQRNEGTNYEVPNAAQGSQKWRHNLPKKFAAGMLIEKLLES